MLKCLPFQEGESDNTSILFFSQSIRNDTDKVDKIKRMDKNRNIKIERSKKVFFFKKIKNYNEIEEKIMRIKIICRRKQMVINPQVI